MNAFMSSLVPGSFMVLVAPSYRVKRYRKYLLPPLNDDRCPPHDRKDLQFQLVYWTDVSHPAITQQKHQKTGSVLTACLRRNCSRTIVKKPT